MHKLFEEIDEINAEEDEKYGDADLPERGEHSDVTVEDIKKAAEAIDERLKEEPDKRKARSLKSRAKKLEQEAEKLAKYEDQEKKLAGPPKNRSRAGVVMKLLSFIKALLASICGLNLLTIQSGIKNNDGLSKSVSFVSGSLQNPSRKVIDVQKGALAMLRFWILWLVLTLSFVANSNPVVKELIISDSEESSYIAAVNTAAMNDGHYVILWNKSGFWGQILTKDGAKIGANFRIDSKGTGTIYPIKIAALSDSIFAVCWTDNVGLWAKLYSTRRRYLTEKIRVNQIEQSGFVRNYQIINLSNGDFLVLWGERIFEFSTYDEDVYYRFFSVDGDPKSDPKKINNFIEGDQNNFIAKRLQDDKIIVLWDCRVRENIYARFLNSDGSTLGAEFKMNDRPVFKDSRSLSGQTKDIIVLPNGNFVVTWMGEASWYPKIYAKIVSPSGITIVDDFQVNAGWKNDHPNNSPLFPRGAAFPNGNFIISWDAYENVESPEIANNLIFYDMYDMNGKSIQNERAVSDDVPSSHRPNNLYNISFDYMLVSWKADIEYNRIITKDGNVIGPAFPFSRKYQNKRALSSVAKLDDESLLIAWGWGSPGKVVARLQSAVPQKQNLLPFSVITPANDATIQSTSTNLCWQKAHDAILNYPLEVQYTVYLDTNVNFENPLTYRVSSDTSLIISELQPGLLYFWKVLAKNIDGDSLWSTNTNAFFVHWGATQVRKAESFKRPNFILHQNYPNPFNPKTTIQFSLPSYGDLSVEIYDIKGQLVKHFDDQGMPPGMHAIVWDGSDDSGQNVAAGIYLCRIKFSDSDGRKFSQSRKMTYLR